LTGACWHGRGDSPFYHVCRVIVLLALALPHRLRATGFESVPLEGPLILAVTHKSETDPLFAGVAMRRPLRYMAKIELFRIWGLRQLVTALGAFPVDRGAGDRAALETALRVLAEGGALLMFPEGTRHRDEEVHPFLPGVGMLAVRSGAPVVPVAVRGTANLVGRWRHELPIVRVAAGPPVNLQGLEGRRSLVYAAATERMRAAVKDLYDGLA
jgi:1-acyl-sn-glycerol-3-phosphate acyltransferase